MGVEYIVFNVFVKWYIIFYFFKFFLNNWDKILDLKFWMIIVGDSSVWNNNDWLNFKVFRFYVVIVGEKI